MINSTVGDPAANSYASVTDADVYFSHTVDNLLWPKDSIRAEAALIESTRILDDQFEWNGDIATVSQSLRWPRLYTKDSDNRDISPTIIPQPLLDAVYGLAYFLIKNGGLVQAPNDLEKIKIGPINLKFVDKATTIGVPKYIIKSLQYLGSYVGSQVGSSYNVDAVRS